MSLAFETGFVILLIMVDLMSFAVLHPRSDADFIYPKPLIVEMILLCYLAAGMIV